MRLSAGPRRSSDLKYLPIAHHISHISQELCYGTPPAREFDEYSSASGSNRPLTFREPSASVPLTFHGPSTFRWPSTADLRPPSTTFHHRYPKYPGNPPLWGEMHTVDKVGEGGGTWRMRRLPKGAPLEEKGAGDKQHNDLVMKHVMISRACKQVVLEPDAATTGDGAHDDALADLDLAQAIFAHSGDTAAQLAWRYCDSFCKAHPPAAGGVGAPKGGKDEL